MQGDVQQLLRDLTAIDRRLAVRCACRCAGGVLHLVHADLVRRALEVTEAWVRGEATEEDCEQAAETASLIPVPDHVVSSAVSAVTAAARAAARPSARVDIVAHAAAVATVYAAYDYATRTEDLQAARERYLADMYGEVCAIRWPLTTPSPAQLHAAPHVVQVAWDAVSATERGDLAVLDLVEAHARAGRLGLEWSDPAARAVAERAVDEAKVARLLGAASP